MSVAILVFVCAARYRHIGTVPRSPRSLQSYQLTEATSLTIASNQSLDDTRHYSEHGYVNTKESPKEESQFRHLQGKHFSFCSELNEMRQAAFGNDFGLFCFRVVGWWVHEGMLILLI